MAQEAQSRNTNNNNFVKRCRSRNWCFTLNNYMESDIKNICDSKYDYIFQEETGENGTPHLQGLLCFKNPTDNTTVKKLIPRAHIEPAKNKMASINYCSKEESRTGKLYSNFVNTKIGTKAQVQKKFSEKNFEERQLEINNNINMMLKEDDEFRIQWENLNL